MTAHKFEPEVYHNTLGWHEPVLTVEPGDIVTTTTADARGFDFRGEQVARRGNPMTGPFYVKGAEAGDTLVVTLDRLTPNRKRGWTAMQVAANVLDPGFVPHFDDADEVGELCDWEVDVEKGTARLIWPGSRLAEVDIPLEPMVGCFGVAPPGGQAISTATSSTHGGNMDYRGFVENTTVYFPVEAVGALFHIGDGHAVQGDGEIVGTGIEISFEVTFTVDLIRGKRIGWPRFENEEYLGCVGNARPLDQCVQHATTEMISWLQDDFGLDSRVVHLLLGQCVRYDMGNMYDPAYTMVCKVPKWAVERVRGS